jgi:hypothetical protein
MNLKLTFGAPSFLKMRELPAARSGSRLSMIFSSLAVPNMTAHALRQTFLRMSTIRLYRLCGRRGANFAVVGKFSFNRRNAFSGID